MSELPLERWLEDELCGATGEIAAIFGRAFDECAGCSVSYRRQVQIGGAGTADILAFCDVHRCAVVMELKRFADEGAIGQCLRYVGALAHATDFDPSAGRVRRVRGVIVAFGFSRGADLAAFACGIPLIRVGLQTHAHYQEFDPNVGATTLFPYGLEPSEGPDAATVH